MAGLKGSPATLRNWGKSLKELPRTLAVDVAKRAAPALTGLAQEAYSGGQTVYGEARPLGVHGQPLDLEVTGATKGSTRFVSIGTVVRCVLPTKYARYLIRYGILPNGPIPVGWSRKLDQVVQETEVKL